MLPLDREGVASLELILLLAYAGDEVVVVDDDEDETRNNPKATNRDAT